jgi:phospho-N-acetylmuramoyl-pentapeptide-transferase
MGVSAILVTTGIAFIVALVLGPVLIPILRKLKFGQYVRDDGPQAHLKKAGTPTMGGVLIMLAFAIAFLRAGEWNAEFAWIMLAAFGFGGIGFMDDYLKIVRKQSLGLTPRQKIYGQVILSVVIWAGLMWNGHPTTVAVPLTDWVIDFGWFGYGMLLIVMFFATTNAVNFTDGLDGLLAGSSAIVMTAYVVIGMSLTNVNVSVSGAAMVGACLGFLVYNAHPAKVFMGDTGSLGIGGVLAMIAVLTKTEFLLIVLGGLFVVEALSVALQVGSFKLRGKRIFRMSPIHHHFELGGWSEWRIVVTFWLFAFGCALLGIWIHKGM